MTYLNRVTSRFGIPKYFLKGSFWGLLIIVIQLFRQLLLVPFFLKKYGSVGYGYWVVINSIIFILRSIIVGFSEYFSNQLVLIQKEKSKNEQMELFTNMMVLLVMITIGIILTVIVLPIFNNEIFSLPEKLNFPLAYYFFGIAIFWIPYRVSYFLFVSNSNILDKYYKIEFVYYFIELLFLFTLLYFNIDLVRLIQFVSIYLLIYLIYFLNKKYIKLFEYFSIHLVSMSVVFKLLRHSYKYVVNNLIERMGDEGIPILINNIISPVAVVVYSTTRIISNLIIRVVAIIMDVIKPILQIGIVDGEFSKIKKIVYTNCIINFIVSCIFFLVIMFVVEDLFEIWLNGNVVFNMVLFYYLAIYSIIKVAIMPIYYLFKSTNQVNQMFKVLLIKVSIVLITILITENLNLTDVGLYLVLSEVIGGIYYFYFLNKLKL